MIDQIKIAPVVNDNNVNIVSDFNNDDDLEYNTKNVFDKDIHD